MRYLHLPGTQHLLYIGNYCFERQSVIEVVTGREVFSNLFRGYRGQDGAVRNVGLQLREVRSDVIDEHVELLPPPKANYETLNANTAGLNAVIEFLVETGESSRFQGIKIDSILVRSWIESLTNEVGFRILERACQVHVFSNT
jgi:hypothetical protein